MNYELIGDRILVQLDEQSTHEVTEAGIYNPLMENEETDGGRYRAKISSRHYIAVGTVQKISPFALKKLQELGAELQVGDRVLVDHRAASEQYSFFPKRGLVRTFQGLVSIPHVYIEAKINDESGS